MTATKNVAGSGTDMLPLPATETTAAPATREGAGAAVSPGVENPGPRPAGRCVGIDAVPPANLKVIGLDASLTSTGVAGVNWAQTLKTWSLPRKGATRAQRWERMRAARAQILPFIDDATLVVQESPAYSTGDMPGSQDADWLWWNIYGRCASREIPWVEVSTGTLKVYATGNGRATKEDVVQEVQRRRTDVQFRGNDQADALTLAAMGLEYLGFPPVLLPQSHRRALASVTWPKVVLP